MNQQLFSLLTNPKNMNFIRNLGTNYKNYFLISFGIGGAIGCSFTYAAIMDYKDAHKEYKMTRVEKLSYPIGGFLGGGFICATLPIWIFFAPLAMLFGTELTGTIAKAGLLFALNMDKNEEEEK